MILLQDREGWIMALIIHFVRYKLINISNKALLLTSRDNKRRPCTIYGGLD